MVLSQVERTVIKKMESAGTPLRDLDISIYYGIKTGYNKAFIVDQATHDNLVKEDARSAEILKPILRGRDIDRYRANWAGLWLIDSHNGYLGTPPINIADYPAIKVHLDKFFSKLKQRQDKGSTPYNLRNCAYHENFTREKLFWMGLTDQGRFCYHEGQMFCANSAYVLFGHSLKYLCGFLNSRVIAWFIRKTALNSGMGVPMWIKFCVDRIPIPMLSEIDQFLIINIVDSILALKNDVKAKHAEFQRKIDNVVCQIYGITEDEKISILGNPI